MAILKIKEEVKVAIDESVDFCLSGVSIKNYFTKGIKRINLERICIYIFYYLLF
jgi:hypothetical protein